MNGALVSIIESDAPADLAAGPREYFMAPLEGLRHATLFQSPEDPQGHELLERVERRLSLLPPDPEEARRVVVHLAPTRANGDHQQRGEAMRARAAICRRALQWLGEGKDGGLRLVATSPMPEEERHQLMELTGELARASGPINPVRVALSFRQAGDPVVSAIRPERLGPVPPPLSRRAAKVRGPGALPLDVSA